MHFLCDAIICRGHAVAWSHPILREDAAPQPVSYAGRKVVLRPVGGLQGVTSYVLSVPANAIRDTDGYHMDSIVNGYRRVRRPQEWDGGHGESVLWWGRWCGIMAALLGAYSLDIT